MKMLELLQQKNFHIVSDCDVVISSLFRPGTEWERVNKLVDFNTKTSKNTKDMSRMRSIMLQLKQTPPVKSSV